MSSPSTVTEYAFTGPVMNLLPRILGPSRFLPLRTSNLEPCRGHLTIPSSIVAFGQVAAAMAAGVRDRVERATDVGHEYCLAPDVHAPHAPVRDVGRSRHSYGLHMNLPIVVAANISPWHSPASTHTDSICIRSGRHGRSAPRLRSVDGGDEGLEHQVGGVAPHEVQTPLVGEQRQELVVVRAREDLHSLRVRQMRLTGLIGAARQAVG